MKILVTGGAGFIGSATAAYLLGAGHEVVVYDSLENGHRAAVPGQAAFVQGDVRDRAALTAAFEQHHPDAVAHFAAYIEAGISMKRPGLYFDNNVGGAMTLLEIMAEQGVDRLVFSSTAGVYASSDAPLAEDHPYAPANVYAETKLMIERMIRWYHEIHGLRYCVLRYFNACGAMLDGAGRALRGEAHHPESHLIPLVLQVALGQRESIAVFGTDYSTPDGTCIRDYIHIEDLASAHVLAFEGLNKRAAATYNLGNGRGYSIREVIDVAREVTGHSIPAVESARRPGDAPRLVACADRAGTELGWEPHVPDLGRIISTAWAWHQSHPRGYAGETE